MRSFKYLLTIFLAWTLSFAWGQSMIPGSSPKIQVQVIKEDASLYSGQPFWLAFQVKMGPNTQMGWHMPAGTKNPTLFRLKLPKPLVVTRWIWPMPKIVWKEDKIDVFYQTSFTVLAQVQWSGPSEPRSKGSSEAAQWFLSGQSTWGQLIDTIDLTGDFTLPSVRLPNEVPLAQDPLVLSEFARIFYSMPQRLDPALVDWKVEGAKVYMIIRQPINQALKWAIIPTHSRVDIPKSAILQVAQAQQQVQGKDVMLVFDNEARRQWAACGVDEVMIVDEKNQQALVVSLELETMPLSWVEKVSQWWNLRVKGAVKSLRV